MHGILRRWFQAPGKANGTAVTTYALITVSQPVSTGLFSSTQGGEPLQGQALQDFVIDKIDDLKGQDIVALDVKGKSSITDCMIICTGTSSRHVMSIADHVVQESRAAGLIPLGVEGANDADWVVVDLGDVIVHVMQEDSRHLYELEKLWG